MQNERDRYQSHPDRRSIAQTFLDGCRSLTHGFSVILAIAPPPPRIPMSLEEMNRRDIEDMQKDWQQTGDDLRDAFKQYGLKEE